MPNFLSLATTNASIAQIAANDSAFITKEYFDQKVGETINSYVSVSEVSNTLTINFDESAHNYHCTANGAVSIAFSNISSNIGKAGNIVIYNATAISTPTLPTQAKTPLGLTIDWVTTAGAVSIISYYVYSSTQVFINYLGDFK